VFDTREQREVTRFPADGIFSMHVVDGGRAVVTDPAEDSSTGEVHELPSGRLLFSQKAFASPAYSADGKRVAFVTAAGTTAIADRGQWTINATTTACSPAMSVAFDPTGQQVAIASADDVCLVDVASRAKRGRLPSHTTPAARLPVTPGGGAPKPPATLGSPLFLANGSVLAVSSTDQEVSLYALPSQELLFHGTGQLVQQENEIARVLVNSPSRELLTIDAQGRLSRRPLAPREQPIELRQGAGPGENAEVAARTNKNLCVLGGSGMPIDDDLGWIVPREACETSKP
jgi:hypothetical protein